jgi:hypothetical protein
MTSEGRGILSPVRLPVPPLQQGDENASKAHVSSSIPAASDYTVRIM